MAPAQKKYPSQPTPVEGKGLKYSIAIIADLDQDSKSETESGKFYSYFKKGSLTVDYNESNPSESSVSVEWEEGDPTIIKSTMNLGGRGMELSELNIFNEDLYTMDDRTGVIFRLLSNEKKGEIYPVPWVILGDGDGTVSKGFKCEWGCVKDGDFWVGSTGLTFVNPTTGEVLSQDPLWVKKISARGEVTHLDWTENYGKMAKALGIEFPGYVKHESGGWSDILQRWVFLPRRACKEAFTNDERMGTNVMILATENFDDIEVRYVGDVIPTHGFSSFKWIPGTDDQLIVALKTIECDGETATFLMVFDMQGKILLPETQITYQKYEGIEFI